jgi:cbb3-type cytochrome oxidase cytochrome c subunit
MFFAAAVMFRGALNEHVLAVISGPNYRPKPQGLMPAWKWDAKLTPEKPRIRTSAVVSTRSRQKVRTTDNLPMAADANARAKAKAKAAKSRAKAAQAKKAKEVKDDAEMSAVDDHHT